MNPKATSAQHYIHIRLGIDKKWLFLDVMNEMFPEETNRLLKRPLEAVNASTDNSDTDNSEHYKAHHEPRAKRSKITKTPEWISKLLDAQERRHRERMEGHERLCSILERFANKMNC